MGQVDERGRADRFQVGSLVQLLRHVHVSRMASDCVLRWGSRRLDRHNGRAFVLSVISMGPARVLRDGVMVEQGRGLLASVNVSHGFSHDGTGASSVKPQTWDADTEGGEGYAVDPGETDRGSV